MTKLKDLQNKGENQKSIPVSEKEEVSTNAETEEKGETAGEQGQKRDIVDAEQPPIPDEPVVYEDDVIDSNLPVRSSGTAIIQTNHQALERMSKKEYMQRLTDLAEIVEFEKGIILKVNKSYNCWNKFGKNYSIAAPGVNQLLSRLGVCYTQPHVNTYTDVDTGCFVAEVSCVMWKPNDPYVKAYPTGRVSSKEPFYAKKQSEQQEGKIISHAKTRMFKEGLRKLYPVEPTAEELEKAGVDIKKIESITFG